MSYHRYRKWEGHKLGTPPGYDYVTGRQKVIEPFPGSCGDCGKPKEEHIDQMTHEQKLEMLRTLKEQAEESARKTQELLDWFLYETRKETNE